MTASRIAGILIGWYLAQSYSRYPDSVAVNVVALAVVTLGVVLVGLACYEIGRDHGGRR